MNRVLVNPPAGGNHDIPCLPLGYLSKLWDCDVIDFNTSVACVDVASKLAAADEILVSVQARSMGWFMRFIEEWPETGTVTTTPIDVQCCYKFLASKANTHVADLPAIPDYTRFTSFPIFQENWKSGEWPYALLTSYGCPYKCTYCDARERNWKIRKYTDLRAELDLAVHKYGVRYLTTLDDCINLNEEHIKIVSRLIGTYGIEWCCTNGLRADRLTEFSAAAMAESGCTTVGFGVESSDAGVLAAMLKGETPSEIARGLAIARNFFDSVSAYVIVGLPGSDYDKDRRTIDWCIKQGVYVHVSDYVSNEGGELEQDKTFYGNSVSELAESAVGLSWGSKRSVFDNLCARVWLLFFWGPVVAWRFVRMDIKKAVNKWFR